VLGFIRAASAILAMSDDLAFLARCGEVGTAGEEDNTISTVLFTWFIKISRDRNFRKSMAPERTKTQVIETSLAILSTGRRDLYVAREKCGDD
jgi:hypothetical protein